MNYAPTHTTTTMKSKALIFITGLLLSLLATVARADITSGLVLNLTMDDVSGSTAHDSTANHLDGTLVNMPTDNSEWVPGLISGAIQFDGTQVQYVTNSGAALNAVITNKVFTLAAWVKASNLSSASAILAKGTGGGHESFVVDCNGNHWRFFVRNASAAATQLNPATPTTNGNWTHLVAVFSQPSAIMQIYVNGSLAANGTPPTTLWTDAHEMSIGNRQIGTGPYNEPPFGGLIDDVRVYSRALSASDIAELFSYGGHAWSPVAFSSTPPSGSRYVGDTFIIPAQTVVAVNPTFPLAPVSYQWFFVNGADVTNLVNNATNSSLTLTNLQLADGGSYFLQASNIAGVTNSPGAALTVSALPAADLTTGLAALWTLDETNGTTASDSTGNGNTGTLNNFPGDDSQWVSGIVSNALNFTGAPESLTVPDAPGLNFDTTQTFSLSAWVKSGLISQGTGAGIIAKGYGGGGEQYAFDVNGGVYRIYVRSANNGPATVVSSGVPCLSNVWEHVVAVVDLTNRLMNVYVNGQLAIAATPPATLNANAHEVSIGSRETSAVSGYNQPFVGIIDDVRIYNRPLNSADVRALYALGGVSAPSIAVQPTGSTNWEGDSVSFTVGANGTAPVYYQWLKNQTNLVGKTGTSLTLTNLQLTDSGIYSLLVSNAYGFVFSSNAVLRVNPFDLSANAVAYWRLDDASGTSALDSSLNGNTGTLNGYPGSVAQWITGRLGGALNFNNDGSTAEYVEVPDAPSLQFDQKKTFSIAAWVRGPASQVPGAGLVVKGGGALTAQYGLDVFNGAYRLYVRNSSGNATTVVSAIAPNSRWQHLVATFDGIGGSMNLYVNGTLAASGAAPSSLLANSSPLSVGSRYSGTTGYDLPFKGVIDDVRVYDKSLSATQAQQLYASAGTLPPTLYVQPQSAIRFYGDTQVFSVQGDGVDPLSYQWKKDGGDITGATGTTLTLPNLQGTNAGTYSVVLTDAHSSVTSSNAVLQLVPIPAPDITNDLVAYWTFDETNGFAAADASGNGNAASLYGFPIDDSEWVPGVKGGALQFDSTGGNYVLTDNPLNGLATGNLFTFSFWAKQNPGDHGVNPRFICPLRNDAIPGDQSWVVWTVGAGGVGFYPSASSTQPSTTTWHHFVVEYDRLAPAYTLYVDGSPQRTSVATHALADPTASPVQWVIGHSEALGTSTDSWNGLLDDLRVYAGRLLNANDVRALYYVAAQPRLAVAQSGTSISISWPVAALGYRLERSDAVIGGTWNGVSTTPIVSADGLTQTVTEGVQPTPAFYRLVNP
jgi:hypothetical protein